MRIHKCFWLWQVRRSNSGCGSSKISGGYSSKNQRRLQPRLTAARLRVRIFAWQRNRDSDGGRGNDTIPFEDAQHGEAASENHGTVRVTEARVHHNTPSPPSISPSLQPSRHANSATNQPAQYPGTKAHQRWINFLKARTLKTDVTFDLIEEFLDLEAGHTVPLGHEDDIVSLECVPRDPTRIFGTPMDALLLNNPTQYRAIVSARVNAARADATSADSGTGLGLHRIDFHAPLLIFLVQ